MAHKLKIAVIADIIASKKVAERGQTQDILSDILAQVNQDYLNKIESPLTITLGDEFQGLIHSVEAAFFLIDLITLTLQLRSKKEIGEEITLRWGIGLGELSTPIQTEGYSIGMDGPTFWHAREAIDAVHEQNDYGKLNEKIVCGSDNDDLYNSVIRLQNVLRNEWTLTQKETVQAILKAYGYKNWSNQDIKHVLETELKQDFTDQTISKRIISTNIKQYTHARRLLAGKIEEWRQSDDY